MRNLYEILQVSQTASQEVIDCVYRFLAKKHHPDLNRENMKSGLIMLEINKAYEVLRDPEKRRVYDCSLKYEKNKTFWNEYSYNSAQTVELNVLEKFLIRIALALTGIFAAGVILFVLIEN